MSWRTVVISKRAKLDYSQGYMFCRGEQTQRVHLSEIRMLMIESTAVSLTSALLCELMHNNIKVIFCDECYNPQSELIPYSGSYDTADKVKQQIGWDAGICTQVWTDIIRNKILQQGSLLRRLGMKESADKIDEYLAGLQLNDVSNREGMAARIFFNALFEKSFSRNDKSLSVNKALNYGYSILLSAINREIAANGYIMMLGLHHIGNTNPYNLGCDLMEPFRPLVDEMVYHLAPEKFETEEKRALQTLLQVMVLQQGEQRYVSTAIETYVRSVFKALNEGDISKIIYYVK